MIVQWLQEVQRLRFSVETITIEINGVRLSFSKSMSPKRKSWDFWVHSLSRAI